MNRLKQALSSTAAPPTHDLAEARDEDRVLPRATLDSITSRRETLTALHATFASYHKTLSKERTDPRKGDGFTLAGLKPGATSRPSRLPVHWFGDALSERANALRHESDDAYCSALSIVGETCTSLGDITETLCTELHTRFLEGHLEAGLNEVKTFERFEKETDKKRSALEAYVAKGEKGSNKKLTRQDYEHELDQLEWEYDEARRQLKAKAEEIESARDQDTDALKEMILVQLDFARNYAIALEQAQADLATLLPSSRHMNDQKGSPTLSPSRPKPRQSRSYSPSSAPSRSRSSTIQPPVPSSTLTSSTRMNRSFSESSSTNITSGTGFSPSNLLSSLGPGRSRRGTVSSSSVEPDAKTSVGAGESKGNRSRSGSVLERFALTGGGKKKDKDQGGTGGDTHDDKNDEAVAATDARSRSNSGGGASRWGSPSLPSLPSFKKFGTGNGSPSTKKYGTLRDQDDGGFDDDNDAPSVPLSSLNLDYTTSTTSSPSPSTTTRRVPPPLKRTQTAPAFTPSSASPSPASPLRTQFFSSATTASPVGRVYEAKWSYTPADDTNDGHAELTLDKGDLVVVEREINADWWIGSKTTKGASGSGSGSGSGRSKGRKEGEGMFPSAYVVPHEGSRDEDRYGDRSEDDDDNDDDERNSVRSSSYRTTSSTEPESEEEDEEEHVGRRNGARSSSDAAPPPLASRSSTPGRKQPPPPPPLRKRTTYSNGNGEGSPFD